jgi:phenylpropionate dioxygenase-like ring-hydroxylating dioxygenase large terminal subunit
MADDHGGAPKLTFEEGLPTWLYVSEDAFALEREKIFRSAWQIVCHENDLKAAGAY